MPNPPKTTIILVTPVSAPRQTKRDKWLSPPRPCVKKYRDFRDEIETYQIETYLECPFEIIFNIPMPKSYSKRKRELLEGQPHDQKPDLDNLVKAFLDSVYRDKEDKHIWSFNAHKRWAREGSIEVRV